MDQPKNYTDIHSLLNRSQTLVSWKAPLRPYKKRGKYIMRFFLALALILSVIVFFFGDNILLIPIWAVLFLFYILTITPPPEVENKITKFGIETAGVNIRWDALSYFYFSERFGYQILTIVTHPPYSLHSYMVIPNEATKEKVAYILGERIEFVDKPPYTITDRLITLFSNLIPDDEEFDHKKNPKVTQPSAAQTPAPASL